MYNRKHTMIESNINTIKNSLVILLDLLIHQ